MDRLHITKWCWLVLAVTRCHLRLVIGCQAQEERLNILIFHTVESRDARARYDYVSGAKKRYSFIASSNAVYQEKEMRQMEGLYQQLHPGSASDPLLTESFLSSVHLRSGYDLFLGRADANYACRAM